MKTEVDGVNERRKYHLHGGVNPIQANPKRVTKKCRNTPTIVPQVPEWFVDGSAKKSKHFKPDGGTAKVTSGSGTIPYFNIIGLYPQRGIEAKEMIISPEAAGDR